MVLSCRAKLNLDVFLDKVSVVDASWHFLTLPSGLFATRLLIRVACVVGGVQWETLQQCLHVGNFTCFRLATIGFQVWEYLGIVRVYTKPRGKKPDFEDPLVLTHGRHGLTVEAACKQVRMRGLEASPQLSKWRSARRPQCNLSMGQRASMRVDANSFVSSPINLPTCRFKGCPMTCHCST
eukprot:scaffold118807_cov31-Tisochrysis_lutea.AAC.1